MASKKARRTRLAFYLAAVSFLLFVVVIVFNHTVGRPLFIHDWAALFALLLQYGTLLTSAIAGMVFLTSALGTASTIVLGWRNDDRQVRELQIKIEQDARASREYKLRIEQLEFQLEQARAENLRAHKS
jgi:hypothetical protein